MDYELESQGAFEGQQRGYLLGDLVAHHITSDLGPELVGCRPVIVGGIGPPDTVDAGRNGNDQVEQGGDHLSFPA